MRRRAIRRTDFGTVVLHWLLVGSLTVSVATGLRIAADSPTHSWLLLLDGILPKNIVWTGHIPAAVMLFALSIAYAVYVSRAGLVRRIRLDRARLMGMLRPGQARWGAINVVLYWILFATLLTELVTGGLLYFGYGSDFIVSLHLMGTWMVLGYAALHIAAHWAAGGATQLLRVLRPTRLAPPPPPFDPMDLVDGVDDDGADDGRPRTPPRAPVREKKTAQPRAEGAVPPRRRDPVLQANPLIVASAVALAGVTALVAIDRSSVDTLYIRRVAKAQAPVLDGDISDAVWRTVRPMTVMTDLGGNFDGKGASTVEIRAVHDGAWAYFSFVWDDPTRSLKHLPLVKRGDGWHVLHDGYDRGDERSYYEDKFAVLLTTLDLTVAGDRTFHAGPTPVAGKPTTLSGRGLHYTTTDNVEVEVWQWKAASGGLLGWIDKNHFGMPATPTKAQVAGERPYRGGFIEDPRAASIYYDNFEAKPPGGYEAPIQPKRLPKDWRATWVALGHVDLDPEHGDSDGARWWMTEDSSLPYTPDADAQIPVGAVVPGVIVVDEHLQDRAEIRGTARWAAGRWTLEAARRLVGGAPSDVPIASGTYMRVAAFDHSQIHHTRHVRPIRLEVEQ
ncbi:MAG TPA: ethylbenzene dehydrogenase-related protein [Xanthobacteraceae bacterium]|jgi:hypothetical protein|nr:ethylbenzene dehydrogenase-related protein [Xanthobacteraceae bacterium]